MKIWPKTSKWGCENSLTVFKLVSYNSMSASILSSSKYLNSWNSFKNTWYLRSVGRYRRPFMSKLVEILSSLLSFLLLLVLVSVGDDSEVWFFVVIVGLVGLVGTTLWRLKVEWEMLLDYKLWNTYPFPLSNKSTVSLNFISCKVGARYPSLKSFFFSLST